MTAGVSIVMATYNGSQYLSEQLESILSQLSSDDELIIIDDCSLDNTLDIARSLTKDVPQAEIHHNKSNIGVKKTFEKAMSYCRKEIIFLSDQDDIWLDGRKERMLSALLAKNTVAVLSNSRIMLADHVSEATFFDGDYTPDTRSVWSNFRKNNFIGCCMAFRRDVLELAIPFPKTISMHDWWIGSCAMSLGHVVYLGEPTLLYRRHSSNQSASVRRPWWKVVKDRQGNARALWELLRRWRRR